MQYHAAALRMMDDSFFAWPFFDPDHPVEARALRTWCRDALPGTVNAQDEHRDAVYDAVVRAVRSLGAAGLLRACVPAAFGGARENIDTRSLCVARETLA